MPEPDAQAIHCPNCNKRYRWKVELGGKKVQCKCGQKFRIPALANGQVEAIGPPVVPDPEPAPAVGDGYDLDIDDDPHVAAESSSAASPQPAASDPTRCPSCGSKVSETAVICLNCGYNLKEGKKVETQVVAGGAPAAPGAVGGAVDNAMADRMEKRAQRDADMADDIAREHRFNDVVLPLILIGVGLVLGIAANMAHALLPETNFDVLVGLERGLYMLVTAAVTFVVQIPIMFVGIFVVARIFGTAYGGIGTAILKLMAVALCMNAVGETVHVGILFLTGGLSVMGVESMMAWGASLLAFFGLCAKLFDMDALESFVFWLILHFGPWIALFFLGSIIASFFA